MWNKNKKSLIVLILIKINGFNSIKDVKVKRGWLRFAGVQVEVKRIMVKPKESSAIIEALDYNKRILNKESGRNYERGRKVLG